MVVVSGERYGRDFGALYGRDFGALLAFLGEIGISSRGGGYSFMRAEQRACHALQIGRIQRNNF